MEGLKAIPYIALILAIAGITIGASAVVLSKFGSTVTQCWDTGFTINSAGSACTNNTAGKTTSGQEGLNLSDQYYSIYKSQTSQADIGEQLPTIAIIGIMVIIISIIAGVFVYVRYFR